MKRTVWLKKSQTLKAAILADPVYFERPIKETKTKKTKDHLVAPIREVEDCVFMPICISVSSICSQFLTCQFLHIITCISLSCYTLFISSFASFLLVFLDETNKSTRKEEL